MQKFKKYLEKFILKPEEIKKNRSLRLFKIFFKKPNLWYMNKVSISRAFAVGFFCAWLPIPFQMLFATAGAIIFNTNLPISISLVWITNPITMPFLFAISYKLGAFLLNSEIRNFHFEPSFDFFSSAVSDIFPAILFGSLVIGLSGSLIGFFSIRIIWRISIIQKWKKRKKS